MDLDSLDMGCRLFFLPIALWPILLKNGFCWLLLYLKIKVVKWLIMWFTLEGRKKIKWSYYPVFFLALDEMKDDVYRRPTVGNMHANKKFWYE